MAAGAKADAVRHTTVGQPADCRTCRHSACTCCFSTKMNTKPLGTSRRMGSLARRCTGGAAGHDREQEWVRRGMHSHTKRAAKGDGLLLPSGSAPP